MNSSLHFWNVTFELPPGPRLYIITIWAHSKLLFMTPEKSTMKTQIRAQINLNGRPFFFFTTSSWSPWTCCFTTANLLRLIRSILGGALSIIARARKIEPISRYDGYLQTEQLPNGHHYRDWHLARALFLGENPSKTQLVVVVVVDGEHLVYDRLWQCPRGDANLQYIFQGFICLLDRFIGWGWMFAFFVC